MPSTKQSVKPPKKSKRAQVGTFLRKGIADGTFPPGSQLPSTTELATMWKTQAPTVHRAMVELAKEGLIDRIPRMGTYVRQQQRPLKSVGIYALIETPQPEQAKFTHMVCHQLQIQLMKQGIDVIIWTDRASDPNSMASWKALQDAVSEHRIQGLIIPQTDWQHLEAARRLHVPSSTLSCSASLQGGVRLDQKDFIQAGVAALAEYGAKRLGFITVAERPLPSGEYPSGQLGIDQPLFFTEQVRALGLETRPGWIRTPENGELIPEDTAEKRGYDMFMSIWDQEEKPDALLVYTDVAARGVLLAAALKKARIPEDIQFAFHRNVGGGFFCPVPALFLDLSVEEVASQLIEQLLLQYEGKKAPVRRIGYHVSFS